MPVTPFPNPNDPNRPSSRRTAQFVQARNQIETFLSRQKPENLVTIEVSRRPAIERFALDANLPEGLVALIGGTRKVKAYLLVDQLNVSGSPIEITSGQLYVDYKSRLYLRETTYRRFQRDVRTPSLRPYPVTLMQLYRMRLLLQTLSRMVYLPESA